MKTILRILFILSLFTTSPVFGQVARHCGSVHATIGEPSMLLDDRKPSASWIWGPGDPNPRNQYLLVRKSLWLDQEPDSAIAWISAYAVADVWINGTLVDRCPMNCDPEYQVYEKYRIGNLLNKGENTLSAIVYCYGTGMHHRINARGGFFFEGTVWFSNRKSTSILTDNTWKVSAKHGWMTDTELRTGTGPGAPNLIGFKEIFDARNMPTGWQVNGYDDKDWRPAHVIGVPPIAPWNSIVAIERPPLYRETLYPTDQWEADGWMVYDFGKEVTGVPVLSLDAAAEGAELILGTAERLFPDRSADFRRRVNYEDRYVTVSGYQQWSPFTWRGFRYLTVKKDPAITRLEVSAINRHYALEDAGSFDCSDPLLTRIWQTGRFTLKLCSQDTYMDTPWREQTQYIAGDSRYLQQYALYASGLSSEFLTRYNILSGAWSQRWMADGSIRSRYPTDWLTEEGTSAYLVDYELEWVIMLSEYYRHFGNSDLIRQVYPNLLRLMDKFETLVGRDHGVLSDVKGWIVLDHPDTYPMDQQKEITALNCLYYGALEQAASLANTVLNDRPMGEKWSRQALTLKQNILKWLWLPERKLFADSYASNVCSQQTQVYALLYGLVSDEYRDTVINYIISQGRHSEMSFAYYVLHSVFEHREQWSLDYIRKHWGDQMKLSSFNGGWQEGWNVEEWTGDIGSTSHAWCSGPTALLPQKVLGAEPLSPGWTQFRIAPHPGDLTWARGVVPSPAGNIGISWTRSANEFTLTAEVPPGTRAIIQLPVNPKLINGKALKDYPGIEVKEGESGRMEIHAGEGRFVISGR